MDTERILMRRIRKQQMVLLGHVLRNKEIENLIVTGKLEGKRGVGRPRLTFIRSLSDWIGISEIELIRATSDRQGWKVIISDVWNRHGT